MVIHFMVRRNAGARTLHGIPTARSETVATACRNRADVALLHRLAQAGSFLME
jgi:hypothetical protein